MQNFNYSALIQMLQSKGMNYEQIVRFICSQRGIDINQLLEQAKSMMNNNSNSR